MGLQVGIEEEGLTDVMSGLLSGSFSLGGGAGPILGGLLAAWFGFRWAATAFGCLQLAMAVAVAVVAIRVARKARGEAELVREEAAEIAREQENGLVSPRGSDQVAAALKKQRQKDVVTPRRPGSGRRSGQWGQAGGDALRQPLLAQTNGSQSTT